MAPTIDRRTFLQTGGAVAAGASWAGLGSLPAGAAERSKPATPSAEKIGWRVACQLYTFRRFAFYEALEMIAKLGFSCVEPCFFLGLDKKRPDLKTAESLSPRLRKEMKRRMADHGITMPNYYAGIGADRDAAARAFEFAGEMGVETIVAEPPAEAFEMVEKLCQRHRINLAVHNHPKSPNSHYWDPDSVLAVCRGRGKRIGGCCDTGHWVRSGLKPIECLRKMEGRIVSFHLKDVAVWGQPAARDVPLGTGLADYTGVLKELKRQGFRGVMALEYEHDSPKLLEEVAQCLAFVEKTSARLA